MCLITHWPFGQHSLKVATHWLVSLSITLASLACLANWLARWLSGSGRLAADPGGRIGFVALPPIPTPDDACVSSPTGGSKLGRDSIGGSLGRFEEGSVKMQEWRPKVSHRKETRKRGIQYFNIIWWMIWLVYLTRGIKRIQVSLLGKPIFPKSDEFPENFRKGGGSFPIQKISLRFFLL